MYIYTHKYTYNTLHGKLILSNAYIHICIQHTAWHAVSVKQVLQEGIQNSDSQSVLSKETHVFMGFWNTCMQHTLQGKCKLIQNVCMTSIYICCLTVFSCMF